MTMPTGFCSLTARCAARTERGRPRVIGNTVPGNSTMPRTGRMISASGGKGGEGAAPGLSSETVAASVIRSLRLLERNEQGAVELRSMNGAVAADRQTNAPFESTLRQLETVDDCGPHLGRIGPMS